MQAPIIKKVHMFIMMAQDSLFEDAVSFYKEIGLQPKFHLKDKWAEFQVGNMLIGVCPASQELPDRRTGIVMEVEDLKTIYDKQKDSITFLSEPVEAIHGIMASVKDPSGNIFDLYQPTPDKVRDLAQKIKEEECEHCESGSCQENCTTTCTSTCQSECEESCEDACE